MKPAIMLTHDRILKLARQIWGETAVEHIEPSQRNWHGWYVDTVDRKVHKLDTNGVPFCHEGCKQAEQKLWTVAKGEGE